MGEQEQRLNRTVAGANFADISTSGFRWSEGSLKLERVEKMLLEALDDVRNGFGESSEVSAAAVTAFERVAEKARTRSKQMRDASDALDRANTSLSAAAAEQRALAASAPSEPQAPERTPGVPESADTIRAEQNYSRQMSSYQSAMADREMRAKQRADEVDTTYTEAAEVMRRIHGEPDERVMGGRTGGDGPTPGRGVPGGWTSGGGGGSTPGGYASTTPTSQQPTPTTTTTDHHDHDHDHRADRHHHGAEPHDAAHGPDDGRHRAGLGARAPGQRAPGPGPAHRTGQQHRRDRRPRSRSRWRPGRQRGDGRRRVPGRAPRRRRGHLCDGRGSRLDRRAVHLLLGPGHRRRAYVGRRDPRSRRERDRVHLERCRRCPRRGRGGERHPGRNGRHGRSERSSRAGCSRRSRSGRGDRCRACRLSWHGRQHRRSVEGWGHGPRGRGRRRRRRARQGP